MFRVVRNPAGWRIGFVAGAVCLCSLFPAAILSQSNPVDPTNIASFEEDESPFEYGGFIRETVHGIKNPGPEISGVSRNFLLSSQTTLRLGAKYKNENWTVNGEGNLSGIFGNYMDSPLFNFLWMGRVRNRFLFVDDYELHNSYIVRKEVHRLSVSYATSKIKVTVGRQAISWGQGRFLNPIDLITPVGPFILDMEDIPGADCLSFSYYLSSFNLIDVVIVPYRRMDRARTGKMTSKDTNAIVRFKGTRDNLDYMLVAGTHFHSAVWGFDLSLTKWDASFRAAYLGRAEEELSQYPYYTGENLPPSVVHQVVIGFGYAFFKKLRTNMELFYNSGPYSRDEALRLNSGDAQIFESGLVRPRNEDGSYFRTEGRIMTEHPLLVELSLGFDVTDFLAFTVFALADPEGRSAYYGPSLSYSLSDEAVLVAGAQLFSAPADAQNSEFAGVESIGYAFLRWHF